ncbi:myo-inositol 2-dehydrogenase [Actinomyces sp. Chiba101]|uniref:Gfo/Idh/MocA family protein n=1 Tax=Actinomyces TaxID=1654 RepID=UPI000974DEFC|nr:MULTISPECIES: Gfo/Idh/MocA family oxidoreductase [Actinomyces]BAW93670.1 myo-inositol 2-dehydrogenase [Actinomyces sp. Chiba101]GAV93479.1 myo-inositol 2-dehydrogenase [Actinomyces denticolens]SUU74625.1 Inositol 2-dehydrogenase [Actinomyces denticolens]
MSDRLSIGIIGTGVMGSDHAHNLARGVRGARLAAIADADESRARALADSLGGAQPDGGPRVFTDGREMIASGAVDAVIIAAPDPFHAPLALACLEAGLPVLCEKPLAPTAAEAAEVVRAHDALARPLMTVGFMRRFDPGYLALRDRLASGADGALLMTHSVHRNVEAYPGQDSSATVTNSAVHEIDILPWLSGHEVVEVQWAAGRASSLISERHDPQLLLLRDAAGVLHTVELQVHAQYGYDVRCELVCERASVELPPVPALVEADEVIVSSGLARSSAYPADWRPRFAAAYRAELAAWVGASLEGRLPDGGATARDALRTTVVAEAIVRSMEQDGARITVPSIDDALNGRA